MDRIEEILSYWFDDLDDRTPLTTDSPIFHRWFGKDEATDREIRTNFEQDHQRAVRGGYDDWQGTPRGSLALVVLLAQFPRNMYRGTPRAFASDSRALSICHRAVEKGDDRKLDLIRRMFLCMPLMHSESMGDQRKSTECFRMLVEEARRKRSANETFLASSFDYARKHAEIIERFGRYPHRNRALGRESTPEEIEFLEEPGSSF